MENWFILFWINNVFDNEISILANYSITIPTITTMNLEK